MLPFLATTATGRCCSWTCFIYISHLFRLCNWIIVSNKLLIFVSRLTLRLLLCYSSITASGLKISTGSKSILYTIRNLRWRLSLRLESIFPHGVQLRYVNVYTVYTWRGESTKSEKVEKEAQIFKKNCSPQSRLSCSKLEFFCM